MSFTAPPKDPNAERCKTCYYSWGSPTAPACVYILAEKKRRGCEPGAKCKRYKKAEDGLHWSETEKRRDSNELYAYVTKCGNNKQKDKEKNNA